MTTTLRVVVSGRVQGVWYRAWTEKKAKELGLDGWVRNRRDGNVEAVISGPREVVETMLAAFWGGSDLSSVTGVEHQPHDETVESGFFVKSTA